VALLGSAFGDVAFWCAFEYFGRASFFRHFSVGHWFP